MDVNQVLKKVRKGDIAPVYVLYGTQTFLMDELVEEIKRQTLVESDIDFNYEHFDLNEQPLGQVIEAAETFPFLGSKRLVVASNSFFLTAAKVQQKEEHNLDSLEQYLDSPADFSILVLKVEQDKLDERKKIVKKLKQAAQLCSCTALNEERLVPWLKASCQELSVQMEQEAAELLIQFVGQDMSMLYNEIKKMAQYVGKQGIITIETVRHLISKSIEQDVFALVEQVVYLRMEEAFATLHELLKRREEPIKIVILLARQFRMLYKVKDLARQGYSSSQMSAQLRVPPFVCRLVERQSKRFSEAQLRHILDLIAETDYAIKMGRMDKILALELLLLRIKERHSHIG